MMDDTSAKRGHKRSYKLPADLEARVAVRSITHYTKRYQSQTGNCEMMKKMLTQNLSVSCVTFLDISGLKKGKRLGYV